MNKSNLHQQIWLIQLAALVFVVLFVTLGIWQVNRGNFKSQLEEIARSNDQPIFEQAALPFENPIEWRHKHVKFFGRFLSDKQFLLDNQVRDQQAGYNVLTPFLVDQYNVYILVDRGWIPQGSNRAVLPSIGVSEQPAMIAGRVYVPYQEAFSLGSIAEGEDRGWPRRVQYVDYSELAARLGLGLQSFTLRLAAQQPFGYRRDWLDNQIPAKKHYGYAFQWFALAAAVVVLWLAYIVRPALKNNEQ